MEPEVYQRMAALENRHWWFRGRRRILRAMLRRYAPAKRPLEILEAGAGTGGNLALLGQFGRVSAFEPDPDAAAHARRSGINVRAGSLPDDHPFNDKSFDLITLFDVLEHVEHDRESLASMARLLKPGGRLMLTVPAMPILWGPHDEHHLHFRRYRKSGLNKKLTTAGFRLVRTGYYNFWLFPFVFLVRLLKRARRSTRTDEAACPPPPVNSLLENVFASERFLLPWLSFPFGVSLWAVAEAPDAAETAPGVDSGVARKA